MPAKEPSAYKRVVTWAVVAADADADYKAVEAQVKAISINGVHWVGVPSVEPHVFGLSKLIITCDIVIDDDLTETIEKAIAALSTEDLEISAEVINMDFQEMQEAPKKKEAAPPAAAEEEEEEEAPKPKAEAKYMRVITWEIVPANTDADFNQCIEQIKSIQIEGVQWTGTPSVVPHVFGLSKIVIVSNITCDDDKSDAIMAAVEKLSTEETEFSAEAVNIDFQEMQAPPKKKLSELDQLKAELEAEKKKGAEKDAIIAQLKADIAAAQGGGKKAAGGKPAAEGKAAAPAKEAKEELPAGLDRKLAAKCEQDGSAKASELKKMHDESGNKFFAANVEGPEGNVDGLVVALKAANKKVPTLGKIFISGGLDKIAVAAWVPADEAGTVDKKAWLEAALETYGGLSASTDVSEDGDVTKLTVKQDSAKGWFPLKMKDEIVGNAFGYLRSKGLLVDDDEDDGIDMAALGGME